MITQVRFGSKASGEIEGAFAESAGSGTTGGSVR
jgi:hypothetical protein